MKYIVLFFYMISLICCNRQPGSGIMSTSKNKSNPLSGSKVCVSDAAQRKCEEVTFTKQGIEKKSQDRSEESKNLNDVGVCNKAFFEQTVEFLNNNISEECHEHGGCLEGSTMRWSGIQLGNTVPTHLTMNLSAETSTRSPGLHVNAGLDINFASGTKDTQIYRSVLSNLFYLHSLSSIILMRCGNQVPPELYEMLKSDIESRYCGSNNGGQCPATNEEGEALCTMKYIPEPKKKIPFSIKFASSFRPGDTQYRLSFSIGGASSAGSGGFDPASGVQTAARQYLEAQASFGSGDVDSGSGNSSQAVRNCMSFSELFSLVSQ